MASRPIILFMVVVLTVVLRPAAVFAAPAAKAGSPRPPKTHSPPSHPPSPHGINMTSKNHPSFATDRVLLDNSLSREVSVNFEFDVLGIASAIAGAISSSENRDAFVKNLSYTAFYGAQSRYNVMVFNLNIDHDYSLQGVYAYGSANYDGIVFGIWVFEEGWFVNKGDGGYINWAFIGWFDRDGGSVTFHKP